MQGEKGALGQPACPAEKNLTVSLTNRSMSTSSVGTRSSACAVASFKDEDAQTLRAEVTSGNEAGEPRA